MHIDKARYDLKLSKSELSLIIINKDIWNSINDLNNIYKEIKKANAYCKILLTVNETNPLVLLITVLSRIKELENINN